ncbi:uncharacterized protein SPPG_03694 [Spizellomyces punctatus DAOM BR117]|uniref:Sfi1 spindle body domain-containing protein n=1 Tax=Spizellomyces punctatus (strain DAOM BR117) TaxID=645134 RepID=A0A0L0HM56_SPIPD|nr:uncharacterized protein SPPG_03694 [Spizellomyces punctatus DAOM BR117]KND01904.1 hypothetical protein SPPG_03694 [Spizellomyces punctatus DAOM BR117]|eukprot:XP_016609943.1 hypothetical protein SPPG_03694 [Spizellomyces punctatus DAOM BR117]
MTMMAHSGHELKGNTVGTAGHHLGLGRLLNKGLTGRNLWTQTTITRDGHADEKGTKFRANERPKGVSKTASRLPVASHRDPAQIPLEQLTSEGLMLNERDLALAVRSVKQWKMLVRRRRNRKLAESHYIHTLLMSTLRRWRQAFARARIDWRNHVKADVHWKYILSLRAWRGWRSYIRTRTGDRTVKDQAAILGHHLRLRQALRTWRQQRELQHALSLRYSDATKHYANKKMEQAWKDWRQKHNINNQKKATMQSADVLWKLNVTRKWMSKWIRLYATRRETARRAAFALKFNQRTLLRVVMQRWISAIEMKDMRKSEIERAIVFSNRHLARSALHLWHLKYYHRLAMVELENVARHHHREKMLRVIFHGWQTYQSVAAEQRLSMQKAQKFYDSLLKRRSLRCLKALPRLSEGADMQYCRKVLRSAWHRWRTLNAAHVRLRELEEVKAGVEHFRWRLKRLTFAEWKAFVNERRVEKERYHKAEDFRDRQLLRHAIRTLQNHAIVASLKKRQRDAAAQHYSCTLLRRFWVTWTTALTERQSEHILTKKLATFHDTLCMRNALNVLRRHARSQIDARNKQALAIYHRNSAVARKVINAWWVYADESSHKMSRWRQAVRHRYLNVMRLVWKIWRKKLEEVHQDRVKWRMAVAHADRQTQRQYIFAWKSAVDARSAFHAVYSNFADRRAYRLLLHSMRTWRERMIESRQNRLELAHALQKWEQRLCRKIIHGWKEYADVRSEERAFKQKVLGEAHAALSRVKLQCAMRKWIFRFRIERYKRALEVEAARFHERSLVGKALYAWKGLCAHQRWTKKSLKKSTAFQHRKLLSRYFQCWYSSRPDWAAIYESNVRQPIIFWGMGITRKTFHAWIEYVRTKRELNERIKDAMGWKRERTMRRVAVQWLKVAEAIRTTQTENALNDQAATAVESLRKVQKFAFKWRAKVLASRDHRPLSETVHRKELFRELDKEAFFTIPGPQSRPIPPAQPIQLYPERLRSTTPAPSAVVPPKKQNSENLPVAVPPIPKPPIPRRPRPPPRKPGFLLEDPFIATAVSNGSAITFATLLVPEAQVGSDAVGDSTISTSEHVPKLTSSMHLPPISPQSPIPHQSQSSLRAIPTSGSLAPIHALSCERRATTPSEQLLSSRPANSASIPPAQSETTRPSAPHPSIQQQPSEITLIESQLQYYSHLQAQHAQNHILLTGLQQEADSATAQGKDCRSVLEQIDLVKKRIKEFEEGEYERRGIIQVLAKRVEGLLVRGLM